MPISQDRFLAVIHESKESDKTLRELRDAIRGQVKFWREAGPPDVYDVLKIIEDLVQTHEPTFTGSTYSEDSHFKKSKRHNDRSRAVMRRKRGGLKRQETQQSVYSSQSIKPPAPIDPPEISNCVVCQNPIGDLPSKAWAGGHVHMTCYKEVTR